MSLAFLHNCKPVWAHREPVPTTEATCTKCLVTKPLTAFHVNKKHKNGRQYDCKECRRG